MAEGHVLAFCSKQPVCNPDIRRDGSGSVNNAAFVRNAPAFSRINDLLMVFGS